MLSLPDKGGRVSIKQSYEETDKIAIKLYFVKLSVVRNASHYVSNTFDTPPSSSTTSLLQPVKNWFRYS